LGAAAAGRWRRFVRAPHFVPAKSVPVGRVPCRGFSRFQVSAKSAAVWQRKSRSFSSAWRQTIKKLPVALLGSFWKITPGDSFKIAIKNDGSGVSLKRESTPVAISVEHNTKGKQIRARI